MSQEKPNRSIRCNVDSCRHRCSLDDYCSLDCVCIGTHEVDPAMNQCTDCQSFENVCCKEQEKAVDKYKEQQGY